MRSKENQRNNARIRNWIKENHPEIADVEFSNNKFEGRVTVNKILSETDVDAKKAADTESKARFAEEYARSVRREKFADKVNTRSGYESIYRSVENHISEVNKTGRDLSVEKSHSVVGSKSFYVIDEENDITIKISDHNTINQQLEHPNTDFIDLLRCEGVNDLLNKIDIALSAQNSSEEQHSVSLGEDALDIGDAEQLTDEDLLWNMRMEDAPEYAQETLQEYKQLAAEKNRLQRKLNAIEADAEKKTGISAMSKRQLQAKIRQLENQVKQAREQTKRTAAKREARLKNIDASSVIHSVADTITNERTLSRYAKAELHQLYSDVLALAGTGDKGTARGDPL